MELILLSVEKILVIKIRFSEVDGNKVVEKDLRALPDTNIIGIGLNDLAELLIKYSFYFLPRNMLIAIHKIKFSTYLKI